MQDAFFYSTKSSKLKNREKQIAIDLSQINFIMLYTENISHFIGPKNNPWKKPNIFNKQRPFVLVY